jgi:hypothetical protein
VAPVASPDPAAAKISPELPADISSARRIEPCRLKEPVGLWLAGLRIPLRGPLSADSWPIASLWTRKLAKICPRTAEFLPRPPKPDRLWANPPVEQRTEHRRDRQRDQPRPRDPLRNLAIDPALPGGTRTCQCPNRNVGSRDRQLAVPTSSAVVRLAASPAPMSSWVILSLMVLATRRALTTPSSSIATATTDTAARRSIIAIGSSKAAIFGVSLSPRASSTAPADRKCSASTMPNRRTRCRVCSVRSPHSARVPVCGATPSRSIRPSAANYASRSMHRHWFGCDRWRTTQRRNHGASRNAGTIAMIGLSSRSSRKPRPPARRNAAPYPRPPAPRRTSHQAERPSSTPAIRGRWRSRWSAPDRVPPPAQNSSTQRYPRSPDRHL